MIEKGQTDIGVGGRKLLAFAILLFWPHKHLYVASFAYIEYARRGGRELPNTMPLLLKGRRIINSLELLVF